MLMVYLLDVLGLTHQALEQCRNSLQKLPNSPALMVMLARLNMKVLTAADNNARMKRQMGTDVPFTNWPH